MRGDQKVFPCGNDDEAVIKPALPILKLDHVADLQLLAITELGKRPKPAISRQKAAERVDAGPGRRAVVHTPVVPAENRLRIHHAGAGVDALRHEVCAVAAHLREVCVAGIPAHCPGFGIGEDGFSVIGTIEHALFLLMTGRFSIETTTSCACIKIFLKNSQKVLAILHSLWYYMRAD